MDSFIKFCGIFLLIAIGYKAGGFFGITLGKIEKFK